MPRHDLMGYIIKDTTSLVSTGVFGLDSQPTSPLFLTARVSRRIRSLLSVGMMIRASVNATKETTVEVVGDSLPDVMTDGGVISATFPYLSWDEVCDCRKWTNNVRREIGSESLQISSHHRKLYDNLRLIHCPSNISYIHQSPYTEHSQVDSKSAM